MLLAADAGPGGLGALIFLVFFVAAIAIFIAMSRSMKRMRSNVDRGNFGEPGAGPPAPEDPGPGDAANRPHGG